MARDCADLMAVVKVWTHVVWECPRCGRVMARPMHRCEVCGYSPERMVIENRLFAMLMPPGSI